MTEHRYSVRMGPGRYAQYVRRPVSIPAPEGTLAFVTDGPRLAVGFCINGDWQAGPGRALPFTPTHWTVPDD